MSNHEKKSLPSHLSPPVSLMAIACRRVCHVKTTVCAIPPSLQPCVPVWNPALSHRAKQRAAESNEYAPNFVSLQIQVLWGNGRALFLSGCRTVAVQACVLSAKHQSHILSSMCHFWLAAIMTLHCLDILSCALSITIFSLFYYCGRLSCTEKGGWLCYGGKLGVPGLGLERTPLKSQFSSILMTYAPRLEFVMSAHKCFWCCNF